MNKTLHALLGVAGILAAVGAGYWWGSQRSADHGPTGAGPAVVAGADAAQAAGTRKILYYRNPMGLPDTSPVPKKDAMGMDYIPVYEGGEEDGGSGIRVSVEKVQKLGVKVERAERRALARVVRAAGRVEVDERRLHTVAPKFEGWVERLHVNATGQPVRRGEALFEVYSPELVSAQREYAVAVKGVAALQGAHSEAQAGMRELAAASLARLRNWDIPEPEIAALAASGEARRTLTFRAPANGIVIDKKAVAGMRFMPGEALYQIADLSAVWVLADVFEQDIALVRPGASARVKLSAWQGEVFTGRVAYVYPTLNAQTRTVPVRIELANPGGRLKPAMFAEVELGAAQAAPVLTVPTSALIDSGTRQVVLVQRGEGRFDPREVRVGARSADHVEILEGITEGEAVVVAANFLLDAESNLKAALGGLTPPPATVGHRAEGVVAALDPAAGSVTIDHGPVASLKWPAMTMDFTVAHAGLLREVKSGSKVRFEFVERQPGEWVVTRLEPAAGSPPGGAHTGH